MNEPNRFQTQTRLMLSELLAAVDRGEVTTLGICWSTISGAESYNWLNAIGIPGCDKLAGAACAMMGSVQSVRDGEVEHAEARARCATAAYATHYETGEDGEPVPQIVVIN